MRKDKTQQTSRLDLAPIIANGLATYLQFIKHFSFLFSTLSLSLKLNCNLSDFMSFPKLSLPGRSVFTEVPQHANNR